MGRRKVLTKGETRRGLGSDTVTMFCFYAPPPSFFLRNVVLIFSRVWKRVYITFLVVVTKQKNKKTAVSLHARNPKYKRHTGAKQAQRKARIRCWNGLAAFERCKAAPMHIKSRKKSHAWRKWREFTNIERACGSRFLCTPGTFTIQAQCNAGIRRWNGLAAFERRKAALTAVAYLMRIFHCYTSSQFAMKAALSLFFLFFGCLLLYATKQQYESCTVLQVQVRYAFTPMQLLESARCTWFRLFVY